MVGGVVSGNAKKLHFSNTRMTEMREMCASNTPYDTSDQRCMGERCIVQVCNHAVDDRAIVAGLNSVSDGNTLGPQ